MLISHSRWRIMSEKAAVRTREKWVDDVKVITCISVVLRHFFQSMTKVNILPENKLYMLLFPRTVVFICSGYFY